MQMRAGGNSGAANITDSVTLADNLSVGHGDAGHVTVQRIVPVAVVDHDTVAVTSVHSGKRDRTTIRCDYRGAVLCADIKAGVVLPHAGYRMPAVADTAGYVIAGRAGPAPGSGGVSAASGISAGVSAVPMAARVSQVLGQKENPANFLLMHAMGPNVAGVIGTAVAAGTFMAIFGVF